LTEQQSREVHHPTERYEQLRAIERTPQYFTNFTQGPSRQAARGTLVRTTELHSLFENADKKT